MPHGGRDGVASRGEIVLNDAATLVAANAEQEFVQTLNRTSMTSRDKLARLS